jgi:Ca2+-binding RTX toxin-like protein
MVMRILSLGVTVVVWAALGWAPGEADASLARGATCDGRAPTIVGTDGADVLKGTPGRDVIAALGGNDTLIGLGGDDRLCGGVGRDRLAGGPGDDVLLGGKDWLHVSEEGSTERLGDLLVGGAGDDRLEPGRDQRPADEILHDTLSWESATAGVHVDAATGIATGQGRDRFDSRGTWLVGSAHRDRLDGGPGMDRITGGPGSDRIQGLGGDDRIVTDPGVGGDATDVAIGGRGDDTISAGGGEDLLRGGPGDDVMDDLGPAADRMYGGPGADMLFTEIADVPGVDQVVDGGGGRDFVDLHTQLVNPSTEESSATWMMGTGRLVYTSDHPVTLTVARIERADLSSWGTAWTVIGTAGPDTLSAVGSWGTLFKGRRGDDTFSGSAYDDVFRGGRGSDRSPAMGAGTDSCWSVEVIEGSDCENVQS